MLNWVEHKKGFITSGPGICIYKVRIPRSSVAQSQFVKLLSESFWTIALCRCSIRNASVVQGAVDMKCSWFSHFYKWKTICFSAFYKWKQTFSRQFCKWKQPNFFRHFYKWQTNIIFRHFLYKLTQVLFRDFHKFKQPCFFRHLYRWKHPSFLRPDGNNCVFLHFNKWKYHVFRHLTIMFYSYLQMKHCERALPFPPGN